MAMGVHAIMRDLPDLGLAFVNDLCGRINVSEANPVRIVGGLVNGRSSSPAWHSSGHTDQILLVMAFGPQVIVFGPTPPTGVKVKEVASMVA